MLRPLLRGIPAQQHTCNTRQGPRACRPGKLLLGSSGKVHELGHSEAPGFPKNLNLGLQDLAVSYPLDDAAATLAAVGDSIGRAAGGTSGGLYHVLFAAAAASLAR